MHIYMFSHCMKVDPKLTTLNLFVIHM